MDNDGDLDLITSGTTRNESGNGGPLFKVYENAGAGFTAIENSEFIYQADADGTTSVGDFDNDGISDVVTSTRGGSSFEPRINLFKNSGIGNLKNMNISLPNVATRVISWIDFDQDHDLDLFFQNKWLVNNVAAKNTVPERPGAMIVDSVYNNTIYFSWSPGHDHETPDSGLSYEIYVGTTALNQDVVSPASHVNTGVRKIIGKGTWNTNHAHVKDLRGGDYFFGVQSIDAGFEGSPFTEEGTVFVIGIHGSTGACPDSEYTYTAEPAGNYTWDVVGGTIISGQGTNALQVKWNTVGRGLVKVSDGNTNHNTLPVYVEETPLANIEGPLTVCTGLVTYLNTDLLSHHTEWTVSGANVIASESANEGIVEWKFSGTFNVIAKSFPKHSGCYSYDTLRIQVDQRPVPEIEGPLYTCTDQAIEYSVVADKVEWSVVNGSIISNSIQSIDVNWPAPGEGYVKTSVASERAYCTIRDSILVVINESPAKPTLTRIEDTIYSSPSPIGIYSWYYNNELVISGSYIGVIPRTQGEFVVEVFNSEGCGRKSDPLIFLITAVDESVVVEKKIGSLLIYPNPADREITAEFTNNYRGNAEIFIYGSAGQLIKKIPVKKSVQLLQQTIDVSDLQAGYYTLIIKTDHKSYSAKLFKRN